MPDKNIKMVNGHPLLAYAIAGAINSSLFDHVVVCTDSEEYASIARKYGALVPELRPSKISHSCSPDRDWVEWILNLDIFSNIQDSYAFILRPTNPFRTSNTILRAWKLFSNSKADTLRAVRKANEHPGKMWIPQGNNIVPLIPLALNSVPFHSNQTASLFDVYIQDASLEIFSVNAFRNSGNITGDSILPFFSTENESFDINTPSDLRQMFSLIEGDCKPLMEDPSSCISE